MSGGLLELMHRFVSALLHPVVLGLMLAIAAAVFELGLSVGERFSGIASLRQRGDVRSADRLARRRIERADLLARIGPILGLMGTLIPLGPGLAALGQGDLATLAAAVITAFDTTVLGLLAGLVGFVVGRWRRRWYGELLDDLEGATA
ncbi:MAG: MotA/TolQ/ExbB proton channel family protein [Acidobacteriota bacterium]